MRDLACEGHRVDTEADQAVRQLAQYYTNGCRISSEVIINFLTNNGFNIREFHYRSFHHLRSATRTRCLLQGLYVSPPPTILYRSDLDEPKRKMVLLHEWGHSIILERATYDGNVIHDLLKKWDPNARTNREGQGQHLHDLDENIADRFSRSVAMPEEVFCEKLAEEPPWKCQLTFCVSIDDVLRRIADIFPDNFVAIAYYYNRALKYQEYITAPQLGLHTIGIQRIIERTTPAQLWFGPNGLAFRGDITWTEFVNFYGFDIVLSFFHDMQNERLIILAADSSLPIAISKRVRERSIFDNSVRHEDTQPESSDELWSTEYL